MTLQQLRYALTIAGCGSMNEAAKRLFLSQPSLSGDGKGTGAGDRAADFYALEPGNHHHTGG